MRSSRQLCIMSCTFCRDPLFQRWAKQHQTVNRVADKLSHLSDEEFAKQLICLVSGVSSRNELDASQTAADRFHNHIRKPFLAWKELQ